MGSVFLIFAYNMNFTKNCGCYPVDENCDLKSSKCDPDEMSRDNAFGYGLTFTAVSLIFGNISNGGYFNPAMVIAVLIQQYDRET
jgi:glycerol uptake facilitator-like aquaporin